MDSIVQRISDYLDFKGVNPFWKQSAMEWIRRGLTTNTYFTARLVRQDAKVKQGRIVRYSATIMVCYPSGTIAVAAPTISRPMRLTYTFDPDKVKAHTITVQPTNEKIA